MLAGSYALDTLIPLIPLSSRRMKNSLSRGRIFGSTGPASKPQSSPLFSRPRNKFSIIHPGQRFSRCRAEILPPSTRPRYLNSKTRIPEILIRLTRNFYPPQNDSQPGSLSVTRICGETFRYSIRAVAIFTFTRVEVDPVLNFRGDL